MAHKISVIVLIYLLSFAGIATACVPCKTKPKPASPPTAVPPTMGPSANPFCPRDTLKLGGCIDLLGGIGNGVIGTPPSSKCCTVLEGLTDLEAAACLCTAIKVSELGINWNIPVTLSLLASTCQKSIPTGFKCD